MVYGTIWFVKTAVFQFFILGQKVRLFIALIGIVRFLGNGFLDGCFKVVVDLPFGFDELASCLAEKKGWMECGHDGIAIPVEPDATITHNAGGVAIKYWNATFPKHTMTVGFTISISFTRWIFAQAFPSSNVGVRLLCGLHFTIFVT